MIDYIVRQAADTDLDAVEALLLKCELPVVRIASHIKMFWVAEKEDKELIGVLGVLTEGNKALLRSFAVRPSQRKHGIGIALVRQLLAQLRKHSCTEVYLLTQTAETYFTRLGFVVIERTAMPQALMKESGLDQACPCSSICMKYALKGKEGLL